MNGRFRNTVGATVTGGVRYGVYQGWQGSTVVLWNAGNEWQTAS